MNAKKAKERALDKTRPAFSRPDGELGVEDLLEAMEALNRMTIKSNIAYVHPTQLKELWDALEGEVGLGGES